jgi:hypothetical protein
MGGIVVSNKPVLSMVALVAVAACSGPNIAPSGPASAAATPVGSSSPSMPVETPGPEPTALPVGTPSRFTSPLYGYTLTLPAGWTAFAAMLRWDGTSQPSHDDVEVDQFSGATSASAWAFAGPVTFDLAGFVQDRIKANARDHGDTCPATPEVNEPIEIGGEIGILLGWNCGILINQAVIVHDGVGFTLVVRDPDVHAATDVDDRVLLEALLDSVMFPT